MSTGTLNVNIENIFPVIKKFLYTDQEIFLRELTSNAVDACKKLDHLVVAGQAQEVDTDFKIGITLDTDAKTLTISDNGIGMTADEVVKYINNIAFSGAKDFADKYSEGKDNIIGHFGLGFYSAFMVADKVDILTKSFQKDAQAVKWSCDGSPNYTLEEIDKSNIGTDIVLHISEESKEYLESVRIQNLVDKYLRFMPIPIEFGTEEVETDEKDSEDKPIMATQAKIVNNITPTWVKPPSELSDEDYKNFYRELYPHKFDEPLFNIHINIEYPFQVNGILYFPRLGNTIEDHREKVKLYQKQVFVTDNLQDILPEFLSLMHGVIDSTDIPLNVSRSSLQSDTKVKKISTYITKKVADKLEKLFKKDRPELESKWNEIKLITSFGMLSDEKFYEKIIPIYLFKTQEGTMQTLAELKEAKADLQTDKNNKFTLLYSADFEKDHLLIQKANKAGYKVVEMNLPFTSHLIQTLEMKEDIVAKQIDSESFNKWIDKAEENSSVLTDEQKTKIIELVKVALDDEKKSVMVENLDSDDMPLDIVEPEFMRRMKEMNTMGGMNMGNMPEMFNVIINANHPLTSEILNLEDEAARKQKINHLYNIALLSKNMLKGEALTQFIETAIKKV